VKPGSAARWGGVGAGDARLCGVVCAVAGMLSLPVSAIAQAPRWEVDLSGSRIEYDSLAPLNAPSMSALAEWRRPSLFGRLLGSVTGFQASGWSGQARGDLARWLSPFGVRSPVRLEFAGTGAGSHHSSGFNATILRGDVRVHVRGRRAGAWVGTSLATARNSFDTARVGGVIPSVGLWAQSGSIRATLGGSATRVSGATYPEANLALSFTRGTVDLTAYAGFRQSPRTVLSDDEGWAGLTAAVWVRPRAAVVISGGEYSPDLLQGLPGGRFFSIGIRLTSGRSRPIPLTTPAPIVYTPAAARSGSIGFEVDGAEQVEIAGDWTGWERVPMTQDSRGRWIVPAVLQPGVYRFNLRVDGERWIVPDAVPAIDDGYGGRVGLLIISN
jgi:hypothetical protein